MSEWAVIEDAGPDWVVKWCDSEEKALAEAKRITAQTGNICYVTKEIHYTERKTDVVVTRVGRD